jgi:hypothetical protein
LWTVKIIEPAQCSVGLFVNFVHVKETLLKDNDIVGLGLIGVLAFEGTFFPLPFYVCISGCVLCAVFCLVL